jgi:molybdate transport system regulatory protein
MSFRQAWLLLKAVEDMFGQPVIATHRGGSGGGGSVLTELGREVVSNYRQLERASALAVMKQLIVLEERLDAGFRAPQRRPISRKSPRTKS